MVSYIGPDALKPLRPLLPPPLLTPTRRSPASTLSGHSPRSTVSSPSSPASDAEGELSHWPHHLTVISALKGKNIGPETRAEVASSLRKLIDADFGGEWREQLVSLLASSHNGLIASTLENNACKAFNCAKQELDGALQGSQPASGRLTKELWPKMVHDVVPNVSAMLYPLEEHTPHNSGSTFKTRYELLRHFRDRVIYPLLRHYMCRNERDKRQLWPMLASVDFETREDTEPYWRFERLFIDLMETKPSNCGVACDDSYTVFHRNNHRAVDGDEVEKTTVRRKLGTYVQPSLSIGSDAKDSLEKPSSAGAQRRSSKASLRHPASASILRDRRDYCIEISDGAVSMMAAPVEKKPRARTLPISKSVRWEDQEEGLGSQMKQSVDA